jgi:uncharacterized RDD family membrane protein YckC/Tfp pilus assembly major pilin PilA
MHGESPASNRYAVSPATASQADQASRGLIPYAGFWRRAGAWVIDYFILAIALQILTRAALGGPAHVDPNRTFNMTVFIGFVLYYTLFESSGMQATPGKRALSIKVTDLQGEKINFGQALGRLFGHIVSFLILGVGFAMAVFTERRQTLHDKMAGTLVVKREESPEDIAQADIAPPAPLWQSIAAVVGIVLFNPFGIGVLAAIAIPAYQSYTIRAQIAQGLAVAEPYKAAVEAAFANGTPLNFINTAKVGVSLPDTAKYVDAVRVDQGTVQIQFGRAAHRRIAGARLMLMPGVRGTTVTWFCGRATPASSLIVPFQGYERFTNIPDNILPMACRRP